MKNVPVILEGIFVGTRTERFGDKTAEMAVFLIETESVPMFVPNNMLEQVQKYPKMKNGSIAASVTFRDQKPGGYFSLQKFAFDA